MVARNAPFPVRRLALIHCRFISLSNTASIGRRSGNRFSLVRCVADFGRASATALWRRDTGRPAGPWLQRCSRFSCETSPVESPTQSAPTYLIRCAFLMQELRPRASSTPAAVSVSSRISKISIDSSQSSGARLAAFPKFRRAVRSQPCSRGSCGPARKGSPVFLRFASDGTLIVRSFGTSAT